MPDPKHDEVLAANCKGLIEHFLLNAYPAIHTHTFGMGQPCAGVDVAPNLRTKTNPSYHVVVWGGSPNPQAPDLVPSNMSQNSNGCPPTPPPAV